MQPAADANVGDGALTVEHALHEVRDLVAQRIVLRVEAGDDTSLAIQEKLVEVPPDLARELRIRRFVG